MRKSWISIIAVVVLIVLTLIGGTVLSAKGKPGVWSEKRNVQIGNKKLAVEAVFVDLNNRKVKMKVALAGGQIGKTEELAALAKRNYAVAAINGTFFNAYSDMQPQGNIQIGGKFLHLSGSGSTVGFGSNNTAQFNTLRVGINGYVYDKENKGYDWRATGINHHFTNPNNMLIFTPEIGVKTNAGKGTSVIVRKGVVAKSVAGQADIPKDGYVLYIGPHVNYTGYYERYAPGNRIGYAYSYRNKDERVIDWSKMQYSVGAGPTLLRAGKIIADPRSEGQTDPKLTTSSSLRSGIGKTKNNTLIMVTVHRATIKELAMVMQRMGATDAINLDGGASSGLYFRGKYMTKPGRKISNGIIVQELK